MGPIFCALVPQVGWHSTKCFQAPLAWPQVLLWVMSVMNMVASSFLHLCIWHSGKVIAAEHSEHQARPWQFSVVGKHYLILQWVFPLGILPRDVHVVCPSRDFVVYAYILQQMQTGRWCMDSLIVQRQPDLTPPEYSALENKPAMSQGTHHLYTSLDKKGCVCMCVCTFVYTCMCECVCMLGDVCGCLLYVC